MRRQILPAWILAAKAMNNLTQFTEFQPTKVDTTLPRLHLNDGVLECCKWLALLLMTGDHINKYLMGDSSPILFNAGRAAMPIFVFVLAYNLARPGAFEHGAYHRVIERLVISGLVATPAFIALGGLLSGWWPLNIMFTLLTLTCVLYLFESGGTVNKITAATIFLAAGSCVEFWWPAISLGASVWFYSRRPSVASLAVGTISCAALYFVNSNFWAFAAFPLVACVARLNFRVPRTRWIFYTYYPAHLILLLLAQQTLSR